MTQQDLIEAVKAAVSEGVTQALVELRKDDQTKVQLMVQLVESAQHQLSDCQAELKALQSDMRSVTHELINARTGGDTWRYLAEQRDRQITDLKDTVASLREELAKRK